MTRGSDNAPHKSKDVYRDTLNLPKTRFPMRANLVRNEPIVQKRWQRQQLAERIRQAPSPKGPYVFHDGPPYANGPIHMGHLLNKVLKDLVVRSRNMAGYAVDFVPGWDCHGLPIEHKVTKELGPRARELDTLQIRERCRRYAEKYVRMQAEQMQRLGTLARYDAPYLTMTPDYEGAVLDVFAELVAQGAVYRALKPVHWSIANRTALADAELEYYERADTSIYVLFDIATPNVLPAGLNVPAGEPVHLMIWTTTPWTLPANLAVAVHPEGRYGLYRVAYAERTVNAIVVEDLAEQVFARAGAGRFTQLGVCRGSELAGSSDYQHPFATRTGPIVTADYVTFDDGTGLVHTAPGHGEEDYRTGMRAGLDVYCPVQSDGTFDSTVPEWLQRKSVWEGNTHIVEHLSQSGHLFHSETIQHSYPHDWRSKTPTIFRATEQWFVGVDTPLARDGRTLRELATEAARERVQFIPEWGRARLLGMLEARPDWCISRQRAWGLPIPAFRDPRGRVLLTAASVRAVAAVIAERGSNAWFEAKPTELLAHYRPDTDPDKPDWLDPSNLDDLEVGTDIFDVWFESGSSWNAVLRARELGFPADLYLEGSDQHRGWFQLSLLPALGVTATPPFKTLLTHGFMVDAQGRKMSKSLGNTIDVQDLLKNFGADICRWWVCGLNTAGDVKVDWEYFKTASEEYRKVRNTIRFLLGNLRDFDPENDAHPVSDVDPASLDAWALQELDALLTTVQQAYSELQFRQIREAVFAFCNETLSAVYLAAVKDRLYCEAQSSTKRRRTQTVLYKTASALVRILAPVLVHSADEAFLALLGEDPEHTERCVHLEPLPEPEGLARNPDWEVVMALRHTALKAFEDAKEKLGVSNPLDAGIVAKLPPQKLATVRHYASELADLCGVSRFRLEAASTEHVEIEDLRAAPRCARSWKRDGTVRERSDGGWLSDRDAEVLGV